LKYCIIVLDILWRWGFAPGTRHLINARALIGCGRQKIVKASGGSHGNGRAMLIRAPRRYLNWTFALVSFANIHFVNPDDLTLECSVSGLSAPDIDDIQN
jgi:hypothetical protein